jgi:hypothetical protein
MMRLNHCLVSDSSSELKEYWTTTDGRKEKAEFKVNFIVELTYSAEKYSKSTTPHGFKGAFFSEK